MIKILCIGNSFSEDAMKYLHAIAKCGGMEVKTVNLYIGGCPLIKHWKNAKSFRKAYDYQLNGERTGKKISMRKALKSETWDYISFQQASYDSGVEESYYPYLTLLSEYAKKKSPGAVQLIHKTWAYEIDSIHDGFAKYERNQKLMFDSLSKAYKKAAEAINAEIVPVGDVIQALRATKEFDYEKGGLSLCRDGFHLDYIYGRYAAAATWYEKALKGNILENSFIPEYNGIRADEALIEAIKRTVHEICS